MRERGRRRDFTFSVILDFREKETRACEASKGNSNIYIREVGKVFEQKEYIESLSEQRRAETGEEKRGRKCERSTFIFFSTFSLLPRPLLLVFISRLVRSEFTTHSRMRCNVR